MRQIQTLLVANRGEIARRILRTCRALGIRGAVVFTDADAGLPFVAEADVAVRIGEGPAGASYLDADRVIQAALQVGADAIHPGYGFLSEDAGFARQVVHAGLIWVGPPPDAIQAMGDKARARQLAREIGVPVLPGYDGDDQDDATLCRRAEDLGTPLLVKATGGGGGRGLRRVDDLDALPAALASARREAGAAFSTDRVLLERCVDQARHIEVQILGDVHGTVLHLGERECSIQRRHQKIVEEAPSPAVDATLRAALGDAAVRIAEAVGYLGAGTVEFLLEPDGRFWFLEVNTRLQVEHPVTEAITGLDLVAMQLLVAEGGTLPLTQDQVRLDGWAIEVRLVAEDPLRDYLPGTGHLVRVDLPEAPGVRIDAGFATGDVVSPYYDALLAKLIAHGPDRDTATRRLRRVLAEAWVPGLATNLRLLEQILAEPAWRQGDLDTGFLHRQGLPKPPPLHVAEGITAGVVLGWWERRDAQIPSGWRLGGPEEQRDTWTSFGTTAVARWRQVDPNTVQVHVDLEDTSHRAQVRVLGREGDTLIVQVEGVRQRWRVCTADGRPVADGSVIYAHLGHGVEAMVTLVPRHPAPAPPAADPGTSAAPTPGTIVSVDVTAGDTVREGQTLVVLEAMKMEHAVRAARDGVVEQVLVQVGDAVAEGAVLIRLVAGA